MNDTDDSIHGCVEQMSIIDTHEHLPPFESQRDRETDLLKEFLSHYFNRDLIAAGRKMPQHRAPGPLRDTSTHGRDDRAGKRRVHGLARAWPLPVRAH